MSSSFSRHIVCPSYLRIIGLGRPMVPLIMDRLVEEGNDPDHWGPALRAITGFDPVPLEKRGDTLGTAEAWLSWWQNQQETFLSSPAWMGQTITLLARSLEDTTAIAWAAGVISSWWWPDGYWPSGVPECEELFAFRCLFRRLGYEVCRDGRLEPGFEKVVIYVRCGSPTHAARQLHDGTWTSKLGNFVDIRHLTPEDVGGGEYGEPVLYMKRRDRCSRLLPSARKPMSLNENLRKAKRQKNDEFYTQLSDIENELRHYTQHFRDKVVYCNCDDPRISAFFPLTSRTVSSAWV